MKTLPFGKTRVSFDDCYEIGVVTECRVIDGLTILIADFGFYTISAPLDRFTIVQPSTEVVQ